MVHVASFRSRALFAWVLLSVLPGRLQAAWLVEPVNTNGRSGWTLDIDVDGAGAPHIAYYDGSANSPLSYEVRSNEQWVKKSLVSFADAFALDNDDRAAFINTPSPNFYPYLQRRQDSGVLIGQQIISSRISDVSFLDFDQQNRPHLGYVQTSTRELKHAMWNGVQWITRTVASGPEFQYGNSSFSAVLDAADQMHFAWQNNSDLLQYARPNGASWQITSPFPTSDARPHDIAIDSAGNVHLAYDVYTGSAFTGGLFYGLFDGAQWTGGRVTGLDSFGVGRTKIVTDAANMPHLFTYDGEFAGPDVLKHVFRNGNAWDSEPIDSRTSTSSGPEEIAVAMNEHGYHVLFSTGNSEVYYAHQPIDVVPGDFDGNSRVNEQDLVIWQQSFGVDARGDGDRDGDTDGADLLIWQRNFRITPDPATPIVVNGDFENGGMASWTTLITPNGSLSSGFPRVETFDVDGDGQASSAMRIRVGQIAFDDEAPAGAGIQQVIDVPAAGDYVLTADIASTNTDITGNTSPGRFELILDDILLDVVDFTGMVISPGQILRSALSAELNNLSSGPHTLRVMIVRPGTNSRHIYQYVDDIRLSPLAEALSRQTAVPEPNSVSLLFCAALLAVRRKGAQAIRTYLD